MSRQLASLEGFVGSSVTEFFLANELDSCDLPN